MSEDQLGLADLGWDWFQLFASFPCGTCPSLGPAGWLGHSSLMVMPEYKGNLQGLLRAGWSHHPLTSPSLYWLKQVTWSNPKSKVCKLYSVFVGGGPSLNRGRSEKVPISATVLNWPLISSQTTGRWYSFSTVAVKNYYKLRGLKQHKFIIL